MRIVYLLTSLGIGGAERQVTALAARMTQRGHAVALLVLRPRAHQEWVPSTPTHYLGMRKNPASVVRGMFQARRFLGRFDADVIHSHGFHGNLVNRLVSSSLHRPVTVSTIHNVYEGGWLRMRAYRITDELTVRTTAVSEAVAESFVRIGAVSAERCAVMRNAVELEGLVPNAERRREVRELNRADGNFIWLAAGRAVPAKDYPTMLRAFAQIQGDWPGAQLWIAGEGTNTCMALQRLAVDLGVQQSVRFLGLRRDLPALLDATDGFVMSSAWEGMPLVVGEAMAMGKDVVCTDAGGVRELTGELARVVPCRDPDALGVAMAAVMAASATERQAHGRAARERIQRDFNMETRAGEWEAFYRSLMDLPR